MSDFMKFDSLEAVLYVSMKYVGSKELLEYNSVPEDITFSPKNKQRLIKRLTKQKEYIENHRNYSPVKAFFKHLAVAVLVVITLLFTACMCIEPIREAVWKFVLEWRDDSIDVSLEKEALPDEKDGIVAEEAEIPKGLLEYKEPSVIYDYGYDVIAKNNSQYVIEYYNDEVVVSYRQMLFDAKLLVSNNDTKVSDIKVGDNDGIHTVFVSNGVEINTLVWHDGQYAYTLNGNLDYEKLLQMAESVG